LRSFFYFYIMQSFIEEVVFELIQGGTNFTQTVFVLPSKRAGTFLKNSISRTLQKTIFGPEIYSIETFVEKISGLNYATNTEQLFALYNSYCATSTEKNKDNFLLFSKWGQTILQDFNEIDRYLVKTEEIFSHLSAIQELNSYLKEDNTPLIENYIKFWNSLESLYNHFNTSLLNKGLATQGFAYRTANENIAQFAQGLSDKKFVFIGFNALNKAEENIIQKLLEIPSTEIFWDIDSHFINDPIHDASYFIRQHQKNWDYLKKTSIKGISSNYLTPKQINIIGVPKNISQAKYIGNLLEDLQDKNAKNLENTAIVLGDENLLNPIMNAIPEKIARVNITMGYPINKTPIAVLFNLYFDLYTSKQENGWFYQQVLDILSHPYIQLYLENEGINNAHKLADKIKTRNWIYVKTQQLYGLNPHQEKLLEVLFSEQSFSPVKFLKNCLSIIETLKQNFQKLMRNLELEYLYRLHTIFNQIALLVEQHDFITDVKSLQSLYKELIASETLDFQGEPLQGTQIMGMLESRNLDFETVIITSVNEGILPSGKSNNSFIPFDIKKIYGLPTYKEKDAVYTYHFYRLLQRAKNIYILYNTEPNVLEGNEKSRLITQLLTDDLISKNINEITGSAAVQPSIHYLESIPKDTQLIQQIQDLASKGFSPTSLTNYIRNPIDFYKRSILKINDLNEVEESLAANTFGTIVHDSLEDLYKPFVGEFLDKTKLENCLPNIEQTVQNNFTKTYADGDITRGKNIIAYNVILKYIENFIRLEIAEIANHKIKILALEQALELTLNVPNIAIPIKIKGKLDRIDEVDGIQRIVDYKTGKVESRNVKITDWEDLILNYDKSKAFQLLCYALLYDAQTPIHTLKAGILSFKNLNSGMLLFSASNSEIIDISTLLEYKNVLIKLIQEIFNPEIPFTEKEV